MTDIKISSIWKCDYTLCLVCPQNEQSQCPRFNNAKETLIKKLEKSLCGRDDKDDLINKQKEAFPKLIDIPAQKKHSDKKEEKEVVSAQKKKNDKKEEKEVVSASVPIVITALLQEKKDEKKEEKKIVQQSVQSGLTLPQGNDIFNDILLKFHDEVNKKLVDKTEEIHKSFMLVQTTLIETNTQLQDKVTKLENTVRDFEKRLQDANNKIKAIQVLATIS